MVHIAARIADNVARVRERIAAAADRAGRSADDVQLVAVTKYVGPDEARALLAAGCLDLGESRPQELWRKAEVLRDEAVRWHMVGHLQRNKVRRTLPMISWLHSGDSQRLVEAVAEAARQSSTRLPILLEVNVSGETAKHGFAPDELERCLPGLLGLPGIEVRGLMAMAAYGSTGESARRDFVTLRELRDRLQRQVPAGVSLDHLSMGMSGDFEVAVEEGATIVRIGSLLFEGLDH
jgi:pyridoxal phosphate enzyme (YggS family)